MWNHKSFRFTSWLSEFTFFRLTPQALRLTLFRLSLAPILLCIPSVVYAQPDSTQEVYEYVLQWGTTGSDTGQFDFPGGICIDDSGYIYVCDRHNDRIQKFDSYGQFILMWGRSGNGQGEFNLPYDIAADHYNRIYVNDVGNHRIQKFDNRGNFMLMWTDTAVGMDVGPFNQLYVAKATGGPYDSLLVYDTVGIRIRAWGHPFGTLYWLPDGVGVDDSGNVYVSRVPSNIYILKFDSTGNFLAKWGSNGTGNGQFSAVYRIRCGDGYKVFTPDAPFIYPNYRVQKFNSDSTFVTTWGRQGNGNGEFQKPVGVAVDQAGFVYVVDSELNRIQKFRKTIVGVYSREEHRGREKGTLHISCYPNPMKGSVTLKYAISRPGEVRLSIYRAAGQRIRRFISEISTPGLHELTWDGRDEKGQIVPSGVYFVTLQNTSGRGISRITVIR